MGQTKTLNVAEDLHAELKVRAAREKTPLGEYVNAVIRLGLERPEREVRRLLAADTSQAQQQEPKK